MTVVSFLLQSFNLIMKVGNLRLQGFQLIPEGRLLNYELSLYIIKLLLELGRFTFELGRFRLDFCNFNLKSVNFSSVLSSFFLKTWRSIFIVVSSNSSLIMRGHATQLICTKPESVHQLNDSVTFLVLNVFLFH